MKAQGKIISANDISICYDECDSGSLPVIFIHGFPFDKRMWLPQMDALENSIRSIAYDIRGFGDSTNDSANVSISLFADDLIAFMDALEINKAIICGLSMGGYIAMDALYRYSERFAGVILSDTQCEGDSTEAKEKRYDTIKKIEEEGLKNFAAGFIKNVFSPKTLENNAGQIEAITQSIISTPVPVITSTLKALANRWEMCDLLKEIKIPALILCGSDDKITPPAKAETLHKNIPGSKLFLIAGASHVSNLDEPVIFNEQIKQFASALAATEKQK